MDFRSQATGIGALADDTRRALYEYVVAQPQPVGREQAATALGIAPHSVNFHLDRLVLDGLLETEYRRLSGKSGPGAGRPSKLFRRASREFAVALPPRRYDLVGDILAAAFARPEAVGSLQHAVEQAALEEGRSVGGAEQGPGSGDELANMGRVLATQGYEPRQDGESLVLSNCPFDSLAQKHTDLVCALNRDFVQGVAEGLGCSRVSACLEPAAGRCCVTVRAEAAVATLDPNE